MRDSGLAESASRCRLMGVGAALPENRIDQRAAAQLAIELGVSRRFEKALPVLYRQSGVSFRHSVLLESEPGATVSQTFYKQATIEEPHGPTTAQRIAAYRIHAGPLAIQASSTALNNAQVEGKQITHLITISCSGFSAPGFDISLIQNIGLSPSVMRTNIGFMGCHGTLNGMRVAMAICNAQANATVLLCAVELCSLHQRYTDDAQQLVANAIFADGAGALVFGGLDASSNDCHGPRDGNDFLSHQWNLVDCSSYLIADSIDLMSWQIGDHGFEMGLSPRVPEVIEKHLFAWVSQWLAQFSLGIQDISNWAIHPGGPRILTACASALNLTEEQLRPSLEVLTHRGNMSSPTVIHILESMQSSNSLGHWQVVLAFGPGLCIEAALLERKLQPS
ncbi:MAG: type III polyketide synthase [Planctomycetales bacterium]|nr:type III polyketide synthase [Planctomycetales bacterium]